jgi:hypothetical protein
MEFLKKLLSSKPAYNPEQHLKIVIISDTHSMLERMEIPSGDILLHAGDFSLTGAEI